MQDALRLDDPLTLVLILIEIGKILIYETALIHKSSLDQTVNKVNIRYQVMAMKRRLLLFLLIVASTVSINLT